MVQSLGVVVLAMPVSVPVRADQRRVKECWPELGQLAECAWAATAVTQTALHIVEVGVHLGMARDVPRMGYRLEELCLVVV